MTLNWPLPVGLPQYRVLSRSVKATLSHDTAHWAGIKWNPWLNRRKKGRPAAYRLLVLRTNCEQSFNFTAFN